MPENEPKGANAPTEPDWAGLNGRSNSSPLQAALEAEIESLIRHSAHDLIAGRAGSVAGLIAAHLAYMWHFVPTEASFEALGVTERGDWTLRIPPSPRDEAPMDAKEVT